MAKWADYCIYAVQFNEKHAHINRVRMKPDKGDELGSSLGRSRKDVVNALKKGTTFVTIFKGDGGNWKKGEKVKIYAVE